MTVALMEKQSLNKVLTVLMISLFHTILNDQFKKKTFKMEHTLYYK